MISFVLPVYNNQYEFAGKFPAFASVLANLQMVYEIIVVDDGSTDHGVLDHLSVTYKFRLLRNIENRGKGFSVRRGVAEAKGDIIFFMDGDFPFSLEVVPAIIRIFSETDTDVVIGDRGLPGSAYAHTTPALRKLGSKILSFACSNYFTPGITDTQCGIKAFRQNAAKALFGQLKQNRFSFDVELLFIAIRKKMKIRHVEVQVFDQPSTTVNIFRDGIITLFSLLGIWGRYKTGKYNI